MVYLDRDYSIQDARVNDKGSPIHGIVMGAHFIERRKRHIGRTMVVEVPKNFTGYLKKGNHTDLTLRRDGSKVWLERSADSKQYMILSSKGVERECVSDELWARGVMGTIRVPRGQRPNCIACICAACRKYGSQHNWDELIVNAKPGEAFSLTWSARDGRQSWARIVYVVAPGVILDAPRAELHKACQEMGIAPETLPFTNWCDDKTGETLTDRREWQSLIQRHKA